MAYEIPTGRVDERPDGFREFADQAAVLRDTLAASGVELGEYEQLIVNWLSHWDWATVAVIASWVARGAVSRAPAPTVTLPGRFDAAPAEIDQHLRRILAEDTYLRYQQAIGGAAVTEAVQDLRMDADPESQVVDGWNAAGDFLDPDKGGNPYPSQLQCSQHDGFGPCPGAPRCTPRETPKDET